MFVTTLKHHHLAHTHNYDVCTEAPSVHINPWNYVTYCFVNRANVQLHRLCIEQ